MKVLTYNAYSGGGYQFYARERYMKSIVQNSRVTLVSQAMHFSSAKDKNPIRADMSYYRVIDEIWEVDYTKFRVGVFEYW